MNGITKEITTAEVTPGVHIPLIGLGTWPLTGEDAAAAVHQAISNGYRHIDTAENYANEAAVGEGIRRSGIERRDLFLSHPAVSGPARKLGKSPAQIILRWQVQHGRVAVPKSADNQRQQENLDVFSFALTQQQMAAIDALETGAPPRLDSDTYFH